MAPATPEMPAGALALVRWTLNTLENFKFKRKIEKNPKIKGKKKNKENLKEKKVKGKWREKLPIFSPHAARDFRAGLPQFFPSENF